MSLETLIQQGEGKRVEFKERITQPNTVIKTAVAFANSGGGRLIIGVEDQTRKIIGVTEKESLELPDQLTNALHDSIEPQIAFEVEHYNHQGRHLIVIDVFPGGQTPYFVKTLKKEHGTFIRVGATNRKADGQTIQQLERQKLNISYDEEVARGYPLQNLDLKSLGEFFAESTDRKLKQSDLINLKILRHENKKLQPTRGGVLLAGKKPLHENTYISCALFKGTQTEEFIDRKECQGTLYQQALEAMNFLKKHIPLRGKITGLKREDQYEIPLIALREALINAIVHRDYSLENSHTKIGIFDDRVELISPGCLPKSLDLQDLEVGRSEIRNKVIARFFKEVKYVEEWGTGINKMIESCRRQGLKPPIFKETGLFFKVILSREKREIDSSELSEQETRILTYLDEHTSIKNSDAQKLLRVSPSRVRVIFESMTERGLLHALGKGKARVYKKA